MTPTPPRRWRSACGLYNVELTRRCYRSMVRMARDHLPNEVGTSLVGTYSQNGRKATVTGIAPLPTDSRATRTTFRRGIDGLAEFFKSVFTRFRGRRHYVGEWHSHPHAAPIASGTDDANQMAISRDPHADCPEVILLIVGGDMKGQVPIQAYVYSRTRGKLVLEPT